MNRGGGVPPWGNLAGWFPPALSIMTLGSMLIPPLAAVFWVDGGGRRCTPVLLMIGVGGVAGGLVAGPKEDGDEFGW